MENMIDKYIPISMKEGMQVNIHLSEEVASF